MTTFFDRIILHGKPEQINTILGAKIIVADEVAKSLVYELSPSFAFVPEQQRLFIEHRPYMSFLKQAHRLGFVVDLVKVTDDVAAIFEDGLVHCVVIQAFIEYEKRMVIGPEMLGIFGVGEDGRLLHHRNGEYGEIHILDESRLRNFLDEGVVTSRDLDTYTLMFYVPLMTLTLLHCGKVMLVKRSPDPRFARKIKHSRDYQLKNYQVLKRAL